LSEDDESSSLETFEMALREMEKISIENIRQCGISRSKMNREIAKMFLLEYYKDLITSEVKW
jgi:hypothetical protein